MRILKKWAGGGAVATITVATLSVTGVVGTAFAAPDDLKTVPGISANSSSVDDVLAYETARAEYEAALEEYLAVQAEYEDAVKIALNAKEAVEQLSNEEACEDSSAYEAALAAYKEAENHFSVTEAKYAELLVLFESAQNKFTEATKPYDTYYDALAAQTKAKLAAQSLNDLVDELNGVLSQFQEISAGDDLLQGDYQAQFSQLLDWTKDFHQLLPKLQPALDNFVAAGKAFETANDLYNASGIAPADNPTGALILPAGYEATLSGEFADLETEIAHLEQQINAYQAMLAAATLFNQRYAQYNTAVSDANNQMGDDGQSLSDYLNSLSHKLGGMRLELLDLEGFDFDQVATVENLQEIIDAYQTHVGSFVDNVLSKLDDALEVTQKYDDWQEEYKDALNAFNAATNQSYGFQKAATTHAVNSIEIALTNARDAYEFNVDRLEERKKFIDGTTTVDDLFKAGNWRSANDYVPLLNDSSINITFPGMILDVSDIEHVSVLEIVAPELPVEPSALPEPVEPISFEAPVNPCNPVEPPTEPTEPPTEPIDPTLPLTPPTPPTEPAKPTLPLTPPDGGSGLASTGADVAVPSAAAAALLLAGSALVYRNNRSKRSSK